MERSQILVKLRERIVAFAASRVGRDAAEDLAQETLTLLCEKYPEVSAIEELVPLSLQILRFKMTAALRKAGRRGERTAVSVDEAPLLDGSPSPEEMAARRELAERLKRAVAAMGARCRELFRLKLLGHTFEEIRQRMGARSINTVYAWDHRCRQELMDRLNKMGGPYDAA